MKLLEKMKCELRILYPAKLIFNDRVQVRTNMQKLTEYPSREPLLRNLSELPSYNQMTRETSTESRKEQYIIVTYKTQ